MEIVKTITELLLAKKKYAYAPVLVPTMGALHEGHLALIRRAREIAGPNGNVAVSIFVNPTQFNQASDLANYPKSLESDITKCQQEGVDLLFIPTTENIYTHDRSITVAESSLSNQLCGASRPGHFDGVCTVVTKLFNIVAPIDAVFGKKDYQQLAIINRLVRDLNFQIVIHGVNTVRETDGLALSSRNSRLTNNHRESAPAIYQALSAARSQFHEGITDSTTLLVQVRESMAILAPNAIIDYLECVDAATLKTVDLITNKTVIAIAAFFGDVRLIDNIELVPNN